MQWTNEAVTLLHLVFLLCSIFCGVDFGGTQDCLDSILADQSGLGDRR